MVHNCSPVPVTLDQNNFIGIIKNATACHMMEINPEYISLVAAKLKLKKPVSPAKAQLIKERFVSEVDNIMRLSARTSSIWDNQTCYCTTTN